MVLFCWFLGSNMTYLSSWNVPVAFSLLIVAYHFLALGMKKCFLSYNKKLMNYFFPLNISQNKIIASQIYKIVCLFGSVTQFLAQVYFRHLWIGQHLSLLVWVCNLIEIPDHRYLLITEVTDFTTGVTEVTTGHFIRGYLLPLPP